MSYPYSNDSLHQFIRTFVTLEGGKLTDVSNEYFTIEFPNSMLPAKFTYQPAIAKDQGIDLIATGTPAFNQIVKECLKKGAICKVALQSTESPETILLGYFKDFDYSCDQCEKIQLRNGEVTTICTATPPCFHQIHNSKISSIITTKRQPFLLFQFFFSTLLRNKLKRAEDYITILVDENGVIHDNNILDENKFKLIDMNEPVSVILFDKLKSIVDDRLDHLLKEKASVFDLTIRDQVVRRLSNLEKRLEEEKLERIVSYKKAQFDPVEWAAKKSMALEREKESLQTSISIKFNNLLVVKTELISFKIVLHNGSTITSSFILGVDSSITVKCPVCGEPFSDGYATEDGKYLCVNCINQSIETGKIYSKDYTLQTESILNEFLEAESGFICPICGKINCKILGFECSYSGSLICVHCLQICSKCAKIFSPFNIFKSKESGKNYCINDAIKCDNCNSFIGIDEYVVCRASGKKLCSCTNFVKCTSCDQDYSIGSLTNGKCPACNTLSEDKNSDQIPIVVKHDPSKAKTKKWLVGRNSLNTVILAKGMFTDNLYVIQDGVVIHEKSISWRNKIRGG